MCARARRQKNNTLDDQHVYNATGGNGRPYIPNHCSRFRANECVISEDQDLHFHRRIFFSTTYFERRRRVRGIHVTRINRARRARLVRRAPARFPAFVP